MMKRITAIVMILCLMLGMGLPAASKNAGAASFTVYVTSNTLKVYSKVSTSSKVLGTMAYGQSMTCLATRDNWAAVKNSAGKIGFCKISGLSSSNPNKYSKTAYITENNTPVYRKPGTSSGVMMKLKQNSSYTAVAVTGDNAWVRLKNGKYYGYVQADKVSATPVSVGLPEVSDGFTANSKVYIISNTLKAYQTPSTSAKSLGTMSYGESMTLLATSGAWARIKNSAGQVGYCKLSGLSSTNPNTLNTKIYINADGVKVHRKPSTSAGVMMKLPVNASYTAVAATPDGNWLRLKNGNFYGYVQSKYISNLEVVLPPEESTVYISENILDIFRQPEEEAEKLTTMAYGEAVTLVNVNDGWAELRLNSGETGYCLYGGITKTNPNTLNATYYAGEKGVTLYIRAADGSDMVKTLKANAALTVIAITEDKLWARVNLGGGSYAYAQMSSLNQDKVAVDDGTIVECAPVTVYVASTTLVCYLENNTTSSVLGTVSFGESMTCTGTGEGWAQVKNPAGKLGYCKLSGLTYENPNTSGVTMYAQKSAVKLYEKATTSSTVSKTLGLNDKVSAVAASSDKNWLRLKVGNSYYYGQASYFATTKVQSSSSSSTIEKILTLAEKQLGIKYVFGAQSPSKGFDCSGFTYYVFKNAAGITLKRTAYTQGYDSKYTKIEKKGDLKVGDLVFFNTVSDGANDLCDHVGIYIGSNKFIHASSGKGEVTISSLGSSSSDYYYRVYSWGRRIIN